MSTHTHAFTRQGGARTPLTANYSIFSLTSFEARKLANLGFIKILVSDCPKGAQASEWSSATLQRIQNRKKDPAEALKLCLQFLLMLNLKMNYPVSKKNI